MDAKHTAIPWEAHKTDGGAVYIQQSEGKRYVTRLDNDIMISENEVLANAAFIAKACNRYEEMRDAIEQVLMATEDENARITDIDWDQLMYAIR